MYPTLIRRKARIGPRSGAIRDIRPATQVCTVHCAGDLFSRSRVERNLFGMMRNYARRAMSDTTVHAPLTLPSPLSGGIGRRLAER